MVKKKILMVSLMYVIQKSKSTGDGKPMEGKGKGKGTDSKGDGKDDGSTDKKGSIKWSIKQERSRWSIPTTKRQTKRC